MAQAHKTPPRLARGKIVIERSSASEISRALGISERDAARARRIVVKLLSEAEEKDPGSSRRRRSQAKRSKSS